MNKFKKVIIFLVLLAVLALAVFLIFNGLVRDCLDALSGDMSDNAKAVASLSAQSQKNGSEGDLRPQELSSGEEEEQMSLFTQIPDPKYDSIIARIRGLDLMDTTPSQALAILEELKRYL